MVTLEQRKTESTDLPLALTRLCPDAANTFKTDVSSKRFERSPSTIGAKPLVYPNLKQAKKNDGSGSRTAQMKASASTDGNPSLPTTPPITEPRPPTLRPESTQGFALSF